MTALIWHKNFGYCLLSKTAAPSIKPKLWKSLAALFVEIFSKKILGGGFRPIWVTQWQKFKIFPQKWRFQIFQVALLSRWLQWFLTNIISVGGGDIGLVSHYDKIERYENGKWWSFGKLSVRAYGSNIQFPSDWIKAIISIYLKKSNSFCNLGISSILWVSEGTK